MPAARFAGATPMCQACFEGKPIRESEKTGGDRFQRTLPCAKTQDYVVDRESRRKPKSFRIGTQDIPNARLLSFSCVQEKCFSSNSWTSWSAVPTPTLSILFQSACEALFRNWSCAWTVPN